MKEQQIFFANDIFSEYIFLYEKAEIGVINIGNNQRYL